MAEPSDFLAEKRYAVVTGANKGIGLEICRQLSTKGVIVVLTSRDAERGLQAHHNLIINSAINPHNLHYQQLDVTDNTSVASLAGFINSKFGKLDILVNNAGISGATLNSDAAAAVDLSSPAGVVSKFNEIYTQSYELAEECLQTNYYGPKTLIQALLPFLELSDSPRIINVSSSLGKLAYIPKIKGDLSDGEGLKQERVDEILNAFLRDFKDGLLDEKGWPDSVAAYRVSKAALNAYTRILANKYPSIMINCVCPGFVKTDINANMGPLPVEEGAASPVRLALMPHGSPSGLFFVRHEVSSFI